MKKFGLEFRQMTVSEHEGFAGAEPGSWIAESDTTLFVLSADHMQLDVIHSDGDSYEIWRNVA